MLQGAEFPPIVVFEDSEGYHLGDGHHRVDAATLAATKDPKRPRRVYAEIRPGSFNDALRWAMRANSTHGKRLDDDDYQRAVQIALDRDLIAVERASEVAPALVGLIPGLSARWAYECSADYRKKLNAKRDRLIAAMSAEGKTQQQIAKALDVSQRTVSNVLEALSKNRGNAKTAKPLPATPDLFAEEAEEATGEDEPEPPPPADGNQPKGPARRYDFTSYLRLLEPFELKPFDEDDSGAVVDLDEPSAVADSPEAVATLAFINDELFGLTDRFSDLSALTGPLRKQTSQTTRENLSAVAEFLNGLARYLGEK
jgi:ParB-like chromosome segregation protein Spo0J